jgi:betaine-aldehyde dehydrogenase
MSGRALEANHPAFRRVIAEIPRGDTADINGAVEAGARAFPTPSKVAARDRGRLLLRIAEALEARGEELAQTIASVIDSFTRRKNVTVTLNTPRRQ